MAFSTFRGMMAASFVVTPPPTDTDTYQALIPAAAVDSSAGIYNIATAPISGSSTTWYTVGGSANNFLTAYIATNNGSYTSLGSSLSISTTASTQAPGVDSVDSTHFITTYQNSSSTNSILANYITNSSGTLSITSGPTGVVVGGGSNMQSLVTVLDSSNALVLAYSATNANNRISLINPTTLSVTQSNTNASSIAATTTKIQMFALSPTLAVVSWCTGSSGTMKISTIDIVSGTSFTINTAYSTALTSSSEMEGYKINSTTALFVYYKSSNTIAARTATIGSGGSVTLNTEYTTTATGIDITNGIYSIGKYSSTYIAFFQPTTGNLQGLSLVISGSTIYFDTQGQQTIVTGRSTAVTGGGGATTGSAVSLDSTHLALAYKQADGFNSVIAVNYTAQTWGTFTGKTSGNIALGSGVSTVTNSPMTVWVGSQGIVTGAYVTSGDLKFYSAELFGGTSSTSGAIYGSAHDTGNSTTIATVCPLTYDVTDGNARALTAFCLTSGTMTTEVLSVNPGSGTSEGTSTTFTATGVATTTPGNYSLLNVGTDISLFLHPSATSSPSAYYGSIITTSGNTINTAPNTSSVLAISGDTFGVGTQFIQTCPINATDVAAVFQTNTTSTGKYNLKMCIFTISGATIGHGTIQTIVSGYTNPMQSFGIATLPGGTTGIVFYTNDASPGTSLLANGFTYSGSTITLGSQNSLATSQHIVNMSNGNGNPSMVAVSPTEAVCMFYDSNAAVATMRLLTYVTVNSITAGSPITGQATTTNAYLISSDNYNNTFTLYTDNGYQQYYRG